VTTRAEARDVICFSLEPWDEVWRRNQHLSAELLRQRPQMRLLFAEAAVDVTWSLAQRRWPSSARLRPIGDSGRLWGMAPRKWVPRRVWPAGDRSLGRQVLAAGARLGFDRPVLWVNDSTYADTVSGTQWGSVYDITDDWLLGFGPEREMARQRRNDAAMLHVANEVVVCSPALEESRRQVRPVHLVQNGVDPDHLRAPTTRPTDLPPGKVVLYQGTLSDGRLDMGLCLALCAGVGQAASVVFVGPNSLTRESTRSLLDAGAHIVGPRPYRDVPAYLQHADVLVVPHQVTPFIESLDPIKAREFLCIGRPVVSTPVSGFRGLDPPIVAADPAHFVETVSAILAGPAMPPGPGPMTRQPLTWATQAATFLGILDAAAGGQ
jgi:teichuronic acid biosynthesis glycosyltransferase TuaH